MSELSIYDFEDVIWDEFCQNTDHMVPHPDSNYHGDHLILGDNHKKRHCEITSTSSNTVDRPASGYVYLSKRRNTMLEKDPWPHAPKEASSLAADNMRSSSHGNKSNSTDLNDSGICEDDAFLDDKSTSVDNDSFSYPLSDITHTDSNLDFFENTQNKDSNDFLYYGWPEIGNFEDVDGMLRSCDATFGLGPGKEDELGWFSSADDIGDVLKPNFKFPPLEPNTVKNISEHNDSSKGYSTNDSATTSGTNRYENSPLTSDKSDSYMSFPTGVATADSKDRFIPKEQAAEFNGKNHPQIPTNSLPRTGGGEVEPTYNQPFSSVDMQQYQHDPCSDSHYLQKFISYVHSDNSHLSDPASVSPTPHTVKSEPNDLKYLSPREPPLASNQLQSMESSQVIAVAGYGKREKLPNRKDSRSPVNSSLTNASGMVQASICDPGSVGNFENHSDAEEVSLAISSEIGSSYVQERTTSSGLDDISLEAAGFRQLQHVMEQLDSRTKLCIRDSLYRLARSAELRHNNHANLTGSCGDRREVSDTFEGTDTCTSFMDIETETNPIDRSVAHLLFHRRSDSSATPAHG